MNVFSRKLLLGSTLMCCALIGVVYLKTPSSADAQVSPLAFMVQAKMMAAAVTSSDPDPFALPEGTVIRDVHVLGMPGAIRSATSRDDGDVAYEADIRTLGTPVIDGQYRDSDEFVYWGEEVDIGSIYNASPHRATIAFDSGIIVDIEPDEAIFTSSTDTYVELASLVAADLECKCRCRCQGVGGVNDTHNSPCADAPDPSDCSSQNGHICIPVPGGPEGTAADCERIYIAPDPSQVEH